MTRTMMWTLIVTLIVSLMLSHSVGQIDEGGNDCYGDHCSVIVNNGDVTRGCDNNADNGYPRDCTEIRENNNLASNGNYMIHPHDEGEAFRVYCDMGTDGGGWTVFQRREDGSIDFYREWSEYKSGFGNVNSEHWLGNDNIHRLSSAGHYELRVDMSSFEYESKYAHYDNFRIGDEYSNYKLILGNYSGDAGDSMNLHSNMLFSTFDRDNDEHSTDECAELYQGAWWYKLCYESNLNGLYLSGVTDQYATGVVWYDWKGYSYSLKTTEMKIRRLHP